MMRIMWLLAAMATTIAVAPTATATGALRAETPVVPVDCVVSGWTPTSPCDDSLPMRTFERTVLTSPSPNGQACPPLIKTEQCQPVHCNMSEWSPWQACQEDGTKSRTRKATNTPLYGGRACPRAVDSVKCHPDDCLVSKWSEWACEWISGTITRTRNVTRPPKPGGPKCPVLEETSPLPTGSSLCDKVDCELDDNWTDGTCTSEEIPNGADNKWLKWTQKKKRDIKTQSANGGKQCPLPDDPVRVAATATPEGCYCADVDPGSRDECERVIAKSTQETGTFYNIEEDWLTRSTYGGLSLWQCIEMLMVQPEYDVYAYVRAGFWGQASWCAVGNKQRTKVEKMVGGVSGTLRS